MQKHLLSLYPERLQWFVHSLTHCYAQCDGFAKFFPSLRLSASTFSFLSLQVPVPHPSAYENVQRVFGDILWNFFLGDSYFHVRVSVGFGKNN